MVDYIIPEGAPMPRALLGWDGADYYVIRSDAVGNVQVNVLGNANLDQALQSIAGDRLQVRGEDQLFSYRGQVLELVANLLAAAGWNDLAIAAVPAGEVWCITNIMAYDQNNAPTQLRFDILSGGVQYHLARWGATALDIGQNLQGQWYLGEGDQISATFAGCVLNDDLYLHAVGYRMTLEV